VVMKFGRNYCTAVQGGVPRCNGQADVRTHPPKLYLQGPPVNRPLKSMTKTSPQSGYLSLMSLSMVVLSLRACAVVTNNWSLFGPPKVHAVTEKAVGKYNSRVTEVPDGSKRRILEPRHLRRNQYGSKPEMDDSSAMQGHACIRYRK
jgi:hypothetical protein